MADTTNHDTISHRDGLLSMETRGTYNAEALKAYCHSYDFLELLFSLSFVVAAMALNLANPDPRQREIPYQQLDSTGEYLVNQVVNESNRGETVSSE